jgi:uncharacterized protein (DUF302 family)
VNPLEAVLDRPLADVETAVRDALAEEGFGILTEIDVAATLEAKLGMRRPPLKILGACNPVLAHRALEIDPALALLLPCNVVLETADDGRTRVSIADPRALLAAGSAGADGERGGRGELGELAAQAAASLERALARLSA